MSVLFCPAVSIKTPVESNRAHLVNVQEKMTLH